MYNDEVFFMQTAKVYEAHTCQCTCNLRIEYRLIVIVHLHVDASHQL